MIKEIDHSRYNQGAKEAISFQGASIRLSLNDTQSSLALEVIEELNFGGFVDSQTDPVPFCSTQHLMLCLFTDAFSYAYGVEICLPSGPIFIRDYWQSELLSRDVYVYVGLANIFALQALP